MAAEFDPNENILSQTLGLVNPDLPAGVEPRPVSRVASHRGTVERADCNSRHTQHSERPGGQSTT